MPSSARARLAAGVELPVDLEIRIPAAAGEPNAVAVRQDGGSPFNAEYTRQVIGEWATLRLTTPFPEIQIEYYDPGIQREGVSRRFEFVWPGDYAADNVIILVQQPTGAENVTTFPRLSSLSQDAFGLFYSGGEIGSIEAGETLELTVTYDKQTDDLTVNFLPVESSAPVTVETPGRVSLNEMLPWGIGFLAVLGLLIGLAWYLAAGRKNRRKPAAAPKVMEPELDEHQADARSIFCHQCGKRASQGDKFCRACGTPLRT